MLALLPLALASAIWLPSPQDEGSRILVDSPDSEETQEFETQEEPAPVVAMVDGLTLATLLDSCSALLDVRIEFTPAELRQQFHPLPGASYTARDLLQAANRELVALGKTTISPPQSRVLRVVKLSEAKSLAGLHSLNGTLDLHNSALPGYMRVIVPLEFADPKTLLASIQKLVSTSGEVSVVGESSSLLVSDLTPRISMILSVLKGLDVADARPAVDEYRPQHVGATLLATRLEQLSAKHKAVSRDQLQGSLLVLTETSELLFIAPRDEMGWWLEEAKRLDRPEPVNTIHYTPRRFELAETRALIQEHLLASPIQAPDPRIVTDELTGALIITATPSTHNEINDLLNRLERTESSPEPRLQAFKIGNRPAVEVQALLSELLAEGVIDVAESVSGGPLENGTGGPVEGHEPKTSARPFRSGTSLGQGEVSLTVDPTNNMILAFGPPKSLGRIEDLIATLDLRQPQIMVEATIVSLSESEARSLGIELSGITTQNGDLIQLASLFGLGTPNPADLTLPALGGNGMSGAVLSPGSFSAAIRALQSATNGRSLSRPKLLVSAGRTADLGSVLQTPYTSTNASSTV